MTKKKEPTEVAATKETKTATTKTSKTATSASSTKATKSGSVSAAAKTAKPAATKPKKSSSDVPAAAKAANPAATKTTAKAAKPADDQTIITTVIVAKFDVGHGNNLYIRGDGHSLSWESGTLMENAGGDVWKWTTTEAREGVLAFKLLINDEVWCAGENMNAPFGETTTFYPNF